jgi:hypothetical protein
VTVVYVKSDGTAEVDGETLYFGRTLAGAHVTVPTPPTFTWTAPQEWYDESDES